MTIKAKIAVEITDEVWEAIQRPHPPATREEVLDIVAAGLERLPKRGIIRTSTSTPRHLPILKVGTHEYCKRALRRHVVPERLLVRGGAQ